MSYYLINVTRLLIEISSLINNHAKRKENIFLQSEQYVRNIFHELADEEVMRMLKEGLYRHPFEL